MPRHICGDHSSGALVTQHLKRPTRAATFKLAVMPPLFGLAPDGVYHARFVAKTAVRSYHTFSSLPKIGGLFSVALSLNASFPIRPPDVIRHPASMEPGLSSRRR